MIPEDIKSDLDINDTTHELNMVVGSKHIILNLIDILNSNTIPHLYDSESNTYYVYHEHLISNMEHHLLVMNTIIIIIKRKPIVQQNIVNNDYCMDQFLILILYFH